MSFVEQYVKFILKVIPLIFLGLYLASVIGKTKYFKKVGVILKPLTRLAKLPEESSFPLTIFLLNRVSGLSALGKLSKEKVIDEKEVIFIYLVAALPISINTLFIFIAPTLLSTLGVVGLGYICLFLCVYLLKASIGIIASRLILKGESSFNIIQEENTQSLKDILVSSIAEIMPLFKKILKIILPAIFVAVYIVNSGLLKYAEFLTLPMARIFHLPPETLVIVASGLTSMLADFGSAGMLLSSGLIGEKEVVISLAIATLLHRLFEFPRNELPLTISIFEPKLGLKVAMASFILDIFCWSVILIFIISMI